MVPDMLYIHILPTLYPSRAVNVVAIIFSSIISVVLFSHIARAILLFSALTNIAVLNIISLFCILFQHFSLNCYTYKN